MCMNKMCYCLRRVVCVGGLQNPMFVRLSSVCLSTGICHTPIGPMVQSSSKSSPTVDQSHHLHSLLTECRTHSMWRRVVNAPLIFVRLVTSTLFVASLTVNRSVWSMRVVFLCLPAQPLRDHPALQV